MYISQSLTEDITSARPEEDLSQELAEAKASIQRLEKENLSLQTDVAVYRMYWITESRRMDIQERENEEIIGISQAGYLSSSPIRDYVQ